MLAACTVQEKLKRKKRATREAKAKPVFAFVSLVKKVRCRFLPAGSLSRAGFESDLTALHAMQKHQCHWLTHVKEALSRHRAAKQAGDGGHRVTTAK